MCPFGEVLVMVSRLYKVVVYVHFGGERPIVEMKMLRERMVPGCIFNV